VGREERVLVERPGKGHGECFAEVEFDGGRPGEILHLEIEAARDKHLIGRRIR